MNTKTFSLYSTLPQKTLPINFIIFSIDFFCSILSLIQIYFINNKGFTLLELSVVLIIIGLLVACITAGSSLLRVAKLRTIINESITYRTTYNTFYHYMIGFLELKKSFQIMFAVMIV